MHHVLLLIHTDQNQQLGPGRKVLQSAPAAALPRATPPPPLHPAASPPVLGVGGPFLQPQQGVAGSAQRQPPDPVTPLLLRPAAQGSASGDARGSGHRRLRRGSTRSPQATEQGKRRSAPRASRGEQVGCAELRTPGTADPPAGWVALARICQPLSRPYPRYSMYL